MAAREGQTRISSSLGFNCCVRNSVALGSSSGGGGGGARRNVRWGEDEEKIQMAGVSKIGPARDLAETLSAFGVPVSPRRNAEDTGASPRPSPDVTLRATTNIPANTFTSRAAVHTAVLPRPLKTESSPHRPSPPPSPQA